MRKKEKKRKKNEKNNQDKNTKKGGRGERQQETKTKHKQIRVNEGKKQTASQPNPKDFPINHTSNQFHA